MIENYKGWDINLIWHDKNNLNKNELREFENHRDKIKWVGVNFTGQIIYGRSLKEIRHIIDYPKLHLKKKVF